MGGGETVTNRTLVMNFSMLFELIKSLVIGLRHLIRSTNSNPRKIPADLWYFRTMSAGPQTATLLALLSRAGIGLICAVHLTGPLRAQTTCWTGSGPVTTTCSASIGNALTATNNIFMPTA